MVSPRQVCAQLVDDVPGCLAVGIVDLSTGMLVGVHHVVSHVTSGYLDAVAAATVDMFRGKSVRRIEELVSRQRGRPTRETFQEILIRSEGVLHLMSRIPGRSAVVVMITERSADPEGSWASLRASMDDLEGSLP